MKKQLIIAADMEGASGIFEHNRQAMWHEEMFPESSLWRTYGRDCITSDVLAVCQAANDFGIDEIMLLDFHFAGCAEPNVKLEKLPGNVRLFDTPNREMYYGRIRGQADWEPFGIITVGQHARYGEPDAYFPHTIHTPPIKALYINGVNIGETGLAVLNFSGTPYIANIGCAASHKEARELSESVSCITVKDKKVGWEPSAAETAPIIYKGVMEALQNYESKTACRLPENETIHCRMELCDGYCFKKPTESPWVGTFEEKCANWLAWDIDSAVSLLWRVDSLIRKA